MDANGFFNFGTSNSYIKAVTDTADIIIVETNEGVPRCLGGHSENVHISEVDFIVEAQKAPMLAIPRPKASEEERIMANLMIEEIHDGACLQLGIGGPPNTVGSLIAESDLRDLGMQSEMMCDAFMDLYDQGKITGKYKFTDKNKMIYTFAMGTQELYEFVHDNPVCASYPVDYTNTPEHIGRNDNMISINNALQVDLYGQIASEAIGDKTMSRIVPDVLGIVSVPRAWAFYVVTGYGKVCLKGLSTWGIAEALISIAHPDFRDDLIKTAAKKGIWRRSNKR